MKFELPLGESEWQICKDNAYLGTEMASLVYWLM
jgi:hypothetical protein